MLLLIIEFCKREVGCVGKYIHYTFNNLEVGSVEK